MLSCLGVNFTCKISTSSIPGCLIPARRVVSTFDETPSPVRKFVTFTCSLTPTSSSSLTASTSGKALFGQCSATKGWCRTRSENAWETLISGPRRSLALLFLEDQLPAGCLDEGVSPILIQVAGDVQPPAGSGRVSP